MLSNLTTNFYATADLNKRKEFGQYMTPYDVISSALKEELPKKKKLNILEPSCGTFQFIDKIREKYPNANITGIEIDTTIYNIIKKNSNNNTTIINTDFLNYTFTEKFDAIIGNPPYFEFKLTSEQKKEYNEVISGRVNIYTLFLKKCIDLLQPNGKLIFVIPTSLLTSKYFENIRKYIIKTCNITNITILDDDNFQDALQQTMILSLLRLNNNDNDNKYLVKIGTTIIFNTKYQDINSIILGKKTIKDYNCIVKTGNIVWNQHKDKLTDNITDNILVYPRNLVNGNIVLSNHKDKKQYIKINTQTMTAPLIAINRIIGIKEISLKPVLIKTGKYYFENHINVITGSLENLEIIYNSMIKKETINYIKNIIGNTQLSKTELETMIPIFH
jgi:adenine-specific DNA-methyltransferase